MSSILIGSDDSRPAMSEEGLEPRSPESDLDDARLLAQTVTVPEFVVFREFAAETVALNLDSGRFHGLNATAGRMIEVVTRSRTVADAIPVLVAEYRQDQERIERSLLRLVRSLSERGLIMLT